MAGRRLPRRVLMTADAVGGVWLYALDLAAGLQRRGVGVLLAVLGPAPTPRQCAAARAIPGVSLRHAGFRLEWMPDADLDIDRAGAWLSALEAEFRPDLVHLNGYAHAVLPWRAPVVVVAHSCMPSWWQAVKGGAPPPEWRSYHRRVACGLHAADAVVAPTAAHLAALAGLYGSAARPRVIRNGRAAPVVARRRTKLPLVFSAGRLWDEAKNVAALDRAAPDLDWPLAVAGDDCGPDGVRRALRHGHWLGVLDPVTIAEWLARAAIVALPVRYEPFGLLALEAAQAGCALVLGDIATQRELWDGAALFVPPDDPAELAVAVNCLIRDPVWRASLGEEARRRAALYGLDAMVEGYCDLYAELLGRGPADRVAGAGGFRPAATLH